MTSRPPPSQPPSNTPPSSWDQVPQTGGLQPAPPTAPANPSQPRLPAVPSPVPPTVRGWAATPAPPSMSPWGPAAAVPVAPTPSLRPSQARMPAVAPPPPPLVQGSPPMSPQHIQPRMPAVAMGTALTGTPGGGTPFGVPTAGSHSSNPVSGVMMDFHAPPAESLVQPSVLNQLLAVGVQNGASDIHFRPGDAPTYRINGQLMPLQTDKMRPEQTEAICRILIPDEAVKANLRNVQEYDGSYAVTGSARFRVNIYRQRGTLSAVLRIIPAEVPTIAGLNLPAVVQQLALQERGLVLVTGATGSGKTSTLAAMIDHINRSEAVHILTIEDPIEFLHRNVRASVSQREIGTDTGNFTGALRSALRQDPDVILVGEMRDTETIDIALKAAETGHLVFSTVHTTDAASTISRLISVFPAQEQGMVRLRLAECLKGSISQRLLARADGRGRVAALEILVQTKTVQEYIRDPERTQGIKDVLEKGTHTYGMQSFDQHLSQLYKQGMITLETAQSAASNPADFERALNFD